MSQLSEWHALTSKLGYYLLHIASSSILQVPEHLWQRVHEKTDSDPLTELQEVAKSLASSKTSTAPQTIQIQRIALNVAERCNLRCTYCYAGDGDYGHDSLMSLETATRAIAFFKRPGQSLHISFFGGEALLNFSLIEKVVAWCNSLGSEADAMKYSLTSNGVLLTSAHMEFFKKHNFELKISYDGKKLQEKQRTQDPKLAAVTEKKLVRFKEELQKLRSFTVRTTIGRQFIDEFANELLGILNAHSYRVQYARVSSPLPKERFTSADAENLGSLLTQVVESLLAEQAWTKILQIGNLRKYIKLLHFGRHQPFCGAGIHYVSVSTSGRFFLCHRFTEDMEECVGDLETGFKQTKVDEILALRGRTQEPCRSCWMRNFCQGGCFHEHKMATGHIGRIDPIFCRLQEIEMTLAFRIYLSMKSLAPQLASEVLA